MIYFRMYKITLPKLTSEQKDFYDTLMHCVDNNVREIFFLDAPGGTGKNVCDKTDSGVNSIKKII